jgi:hypothetical protein
VSGRLASPRFRRRVIWTTVLLTVPAALVVAGIRIGNTGKSDEAPLVDKPAWVYRVPKVHRLTPAERAVVFDTMTTFVRTAVARKHLDDAWPMLGPALRAGMTRKEWDSGFNTVVPYRAVGITAVDTLYSYDGDVAFDISLLGAKSEDAIAKTFTIELTRDPKRPTRWLVASWVPKGVSSPSVSRSERSKPQLPAEIKAPESGKWLLVPLGLLALVLVVPIVLAVRSFVESRRAARRYAEELASYRSTSSPS